MKCDQFQTRCNAINAQKQLEFSMGFGNPQLQPQLQLQLQLQLQIQPTHFNDDDDTSYQIVEKPNKKQTQNWYRKENDGSVKQGMWNNKKKR